MMFTTMDQLNEEFQRNPQASSGRLSLDHYLVLETTNDVGGQFLNTLELELALPYTVTWVSEAGWQARLYQNPFEGMSCHSTLAYRMFGMKFRFGSRQECLVRNDEDSIFDEEVAALPEKTLWLFVKLTSLADGLLATLDPPSELGPESCGYRQIL
jgi:hypothetical protein